MAIRNKNLNLIPLLQALLEERSVARAAKKMHMSQPAMSSALSRLREIFDDPLLVRVGRAMELTPRAEGMIAKTNVLCNDVEMLFQPEEFDPSTADCSFRVAVPNYLCFQLIDRWIENLAKTAPNIKISFFDVPIDLPVWLRNGSIDLAICGDFDFWNDVQSKMLFREEYVAMVAHNHPLAGETHVTIDQISQHPVISQILDASYAFARVRPKLPDGIPVHTLDTQLSSASQFTPIFQALRGKVVAIVPSSLAHNIKDTLPLSIVRITDGNKSFPTSMFWNLVTDRSLQHVWLRENLERVAQLISAPTD